MGVDFRVRLRAWWSGLSSRGSDECLVAEDLDPT